MIASKETPYEDLLANIKQHISEFRAHMVYGGMKKSTAATYSRIVISMLKRGDVRDLNIYVAILNTYAVSTRGVRNSSMQAYWRWLGIEHSWKDIQEATPRPEDEVNAKLSIPTPVGMRGIDHARIVRASQQMARAVREYILLSELGIKIHPLEDFIRIITERYKDTIKLAVKDVLDSDPDAIEIQLRALPDITGIEEPKYANDATRGELSRLANRPIAMPKEFLLELEKPETKSDEDEFDFPNPNEPPQEEPEPVVPPTPVVRPPEPTPVVVNTSTRADMLARLAQLLGTQDQGNG